MTTPTAARTRPTWPQLPPSVRDGIEARLGAPVTAWSSRDGGYSPGLASVVTAGDEQVFVKAVASEHHAATLYRQEAERVARLPSGVPAPAARWSAEIPDGSSPESVWVVLAFDAVDGRPARTPLTGSDLDAVAELALAIGEFDASQADLPPAADEFPAGCTALLADERPAGLGDVDPWYMDRLDRFAVLEQDAPAALAGRSLQHGDLRGDNVVISARGPVAVDWPFAVRGAGFCDLVAMLPSVHAQGGPAPEDVLARHPLPRGTDDDAVTAVVVAETGYFVHASLQPPPPGIPHVRAFQRAQGEACIAWLRRRLDDGC